jgi:hypothetical protein
MRSAWITALINANGTYCEHEQHPSHLSDSGICDPCASFVYPQQSLETFKGYPIAWVHRDPNESKHSFLYWIPDEYKAMVEADWPRIIQVAAKFYDDLVDGGYALQDFLYEDLDDYHTCNDLVLFCTGKELDFKVWKVFDKLNIEQHLDKAKETYNEIS